MHRKIHIIDVGPAAAKALAGDSYWSGLDSNMRGHASFTVQVLVRITEVCLPFQSKNNRPS
ncbi:MAG: hypothetical protein V4819_14530 [Verrucomicrobiota bacterium]